MNEYSRLINLASMKFMKPILKFIYFLYLY